MLARRTAYELGDSQVATPHEVVGLFWDLIRQHREHLGAVLDMGAGDCRFGQNGTFDHYTGIEIDKRRVRDADIPTNGELLNCCAFRHRVGDYDACIGNPPYVRHHDIESPWKENTIARLERELGFSLNAHCNLYLYFLCLGLLKTREDGLVSLVIPYEWVSRPSAKAIRDYIQAKCWGVDVYRFQMPIFDGVMTTASISIIDKARQDGRWEYHAIDPKYKVLPRTGITDSKKGVLAYSGRGTMWALRGLSPGSQRIFTLSEGERIHNGLGLCDVVPCVTSLRHIPPNLASLTAVTFEKCLVRTGEKCWLLRSDEDNRSAALDAYLKAVPEPDRQTYTCRNQSPWFKYRPHPVPQLLVSSGFTSFGPKVLINTIGARAVGSVYGVHAESPLPLRRLRSYLCSINFETRVVAHAKSLKKIEVKQLNTVLNAFVKRKDGSSGR